MILRKSFAIFELMTEEVYDVFSMKRRDSSYENEVTRIRPGYIVLNEVEYLDQNHPRGSFHMKLLKDFIGKDMA